MTHFLELVIKIAIEAGDAIMGVYTTDFTVDFKKDNSPLTKADTLANDIIIKGLEQTGKPVISEEGRNIPFNIRENWKTFWLVDPLDGTKEFVNRNGEFSVNIALIESKTPVMGVIYAPVPDTLYFSDESGAWKLEHAKGVVIGNSDITHLKRESSQLPLERSDPDFTVVVSRSHLNADTTDFINKEKQKHHNIRIVSRGSSLKMCMIAEGKADVYPRFGITSEWDTAAGHAIIRATGGKIVQIANEAIELTYNNEDLENPSFIAYPSN
ncbi:MAG: 3'(2'),5'-bisphosphate nucleotidase [Bacteroidetes bacterium HGW-Bacteroidetes-1]|jgi:3'(2'), 5'-bisphosphate nucleotidase|nr:MAG: 3'(2'),5'-bisphosphate nucleotidase [Bacteroidetes bacterium HGW-Bacteroidetes-1]